MYILVYTSIMTVYTCIWYTRFVYAFITLVYVSICQHIPWYTRISYLIHVYTSINANIRVYTKFQTIWKSMHNCRIRTRNLVHTFRRRHHCTASVNTSVLLFPFTGPIHIRLSALLFPVTWRLVSDVGRGTRGAARPGHDVTGPGLHLEVLVLAAAC